MAYRGDERVVYISREEPPQLLWRSMVFGFGFALGTFSFWLMLLVIAAVAFSLGGKALPLP